MILLLLMMIVFRCCLIRCQSSDLCGGNFTDLAGYFTSPNFPNNYPNDARCYYYISTITISIHNFNSESCCDYLKVYDGGSVNNTLLLELKGNVTGKAARSTSNKLTLYFYSDSVVVSSGFQAIYISQVPVNGNWGSWSLWSSCSVSCGGGTTTRTRLCDNPEPSNGGSNCIGNRTETKSCQANPCPVNGNWGSWSSWSNCSCGTANRTRACDNPMPSNGGLNCTGNSTETIACESDPCTGDLRLQDGPFVRKGRLEIFYDNQWGTVCVDSFDDKDAIVACRQLGYRTGFMVKHTFILDGTGPIWLDDIACFGTEYRLDTCKHRGWGMHDCGHQEDVGVECLTSLVTGALRIIEESLPMQGRLEVFYFAYGIWGTICDDYFEDVDADVACRQMGYSTGVTLGNKVTKGSGTILLDDVNCTGTESIITSCRHRGWGVHNCQHSDDVGVQCFIQIKDQQTEDRGCCSSGVVAGIVIPCIVFTIVCGLAFVFFRKRLLSLDKEMEMPNKNKNGDVRQAQVPVFTR